MTRLFVQSVGLVALLYVSCAAAGEKAETPPSAGAASAAQLVWQANYGEGMRQAKEQERMLLIHFHDPGRPRETQRLDREIAERGLDSRLAEFVLLRLPLDARSTAEGQEMPLLDHPAFAEMEKHEGIVMIDFASVGAEQYGYVVTTLPFASGKYYRYRPEHLAVVLDLPPGTLTQRAMVFAVRIHPEAPASTKGDLDPHLVQEAKQHSRYQARIRLQGHHHWEYRFHRIGRLLPFGLRAQEVVAESWPQENLMDAAVDCVHSWRQSPGHWGAVKSSQPRFAYDIERGANGIWYATGIFGNRY
ncbi:MAG: hypothetical protein HYX69_14510 [Planctomycetia bacterium]|nr:hypothetical protein [Planctomycetia bacterium]